MKKLIFGILLLFNTVVFSQGLQNGPNQAAYRVNFSNVLASTWNSTNWTQLSAGAGQTVSQSGGNGVIATGTTVNSEIIERSVQAYSGNFLLRAHVTASQRIVNQNLYVELVDVVGDALAITVNSATSVTITIPGTTFTSTNVGQFMYIGALTGFTGVTSIPGRYAIASVSGTAITYTVAGWATGSVNTGTCSVFGWNYHQLVYNGTTATSVNYDAQRSGWATGATTATINTTASPGHMVIMGSQNGNAFLADQLVATTTVLPYTVRASRVENIALETTPLYLQIRSVNGSTAPASTTNWTIGYVSYENYIATPVTPTNAQAQGNNAALPVLINNTPNIGTVTTVSTVAAVTTVNAISPGSSTANLGKIVGGTPGTDVGVAPLLSATSAQPVAGTTGKYAVPISNLYGATVVYQFEKMVTSYSAAGVVTATAATATDVATITGSATKTVYITKILVSGSATVAFTAPVLILKRSTANSGTSTSSTVVSNDANDVAGTATVVSYAANPTPGTLVGNISASTLDFTTATGAPGGTVIFDYGERNKPITLRGTSQVLAINLNGTTPAGSLYFTFYWYEL